MPRRRRHQEEPENHERWLVSYADFITLLFAFFVVMYAVSSVNEGKYRVLSNTLSDAFQEPSRSMNPIQIGELRRSSGTLLGDSISQSVMETETRQGPESVETPLLDEEPGFESTRTGPKKVDPAAEQKRLGYIADTIESVLSPFVDSGQVSVTHKGDWVEVDMKSALLFSSGSARLSRGAVKILGDVVRVLKPLPNPVHVEGYTDNVPIKTSAFPSNWELSAARAASVVHLFTRFGMNPDRLAAVGYGEHRPIADNASETGRRKNRRVTLVLLAGSGKGRPAQHEITRSSG